MRLMALLFLFRSTRALVLRRPATMRAVPTTTRLLATKVVDDASAFSKSRQPFSMPRGAPDDSKSETNTSSETNLAWNSLGLWTELVSALNEELHLTRPTAVQQLVIPHLLDDKSSHLTFLAATGSGKTLAYSLPLLQKVKEKEVFVQQGGERRAKRPAMLVLAPTRELCHQISTDTIKKLCHKIKLSSTVLTGKDDYGKQRKALNRPIDIVVATPGRFIQHWREENVHIGALQYIVLDEMDTMLEQGFSKELKQILYPVLYRKRVEQQIDVVKDLAPDAPSIIMTSATMTQTIQRMVGDMDINSGKVNARKHFVKRDAAEESPEDQRSIALPVMPVLKAKGLHKTVPRLQQVFVDVGGADKLSLLIDILGRGGSADALRSTAASQWAASALTMIFCNTFAACRAVQYALSEAQIETLAYHGELNSEARSENLRRFRLAGTGDHPDEPRILVATDLAARGLDVPQVDHVVCFDFPLNALDYLHRSGRTARGDRTGGRVTALVTKRDRVLANAIEKAVQRGEPLDGLTSRKSDQLRSSDVEKKKKAGAPSRQRTGGSKAGAPSRERTGGSRRDRR